MMILKKVWLFNMYQIDRYLSSYQNAWNEFENSIHSDERTFLFNHNYLLGFLGCAFLTGIINKENYNNRIDEIEFYTNKRYEKK